tara:strand:- start:13 stop:222 length:210 start_codon:yes stop_codon:yes gene_type:complete
MKDKINEICNKLNREQLSVYGATNELFDLFAVSQQREQLIAYEKQLYSFDEWVLVEKSCIKDIDIYLSK